MGSEMCTRDRLDYGCIAIHVFNAEAREFYGLERLWRDGKPLDLTGIVD